MKVAVNNMKRVQIALTLVLVLVSPSILADNYESPQKMAEHYQREIQERTDRDKAKFDDLERRANEREIIYELRKQNNQREIDKMIDENNR